METFRCFLRKLCFCQRTHSEQFRIHTTRICLALLAWFSLVVSYHFRGNCSLSLTMWRSFRTLPEWLTVHHIVQSHSLSIPHTPTSCGHSCRWYSHSQDLNSRRRTSSSRQFSTIDHHMNYQDTQSLYWLTALIHRKSAYYLWMSSTLLWILEQNLESL